MILTKIFRKIKNYLNKPKYIEVIFPVDGEISDADRALIFGYADVYCDKNGKFYKKIGEDKDE